MRKFKFFLIGLIPGLMLVFFILNKKCASCSGYLPNSRVVAETLSKNMVYDSAFSQEMRSNKIDEKFLRDRIITLGTIDFDKSKAQKNECPEYFLIYPKDNPQYEIRFEKCKDDAVFHTLKKLR
jgi:hypothetical protein